MKESTYYAVVGVVFFIVAGLHFVRAITQLPAEIGGVDIPVWVSWAAVVLAGYLSIRAIQFFRKNS